MNSQLTDLVAHVQQLAVAQHHGRLVIGIYGKPGSGKSTLASALVHALNKTSDSAIAVGMDGWHYSRAFLDTMPDPAEAHRRRGAAFTFDARGFVDFLARLKAAPLSETVHAPSFLHGQPFRWALEELNGPTETKDPSENGIAILPQHQIVVIEGIYLNMSEPPWDEAAQYFAETWLVEASDALARPRIISRHVKTGVAPDEAQAAIRADTSDLPNGHYMLERSLPPTRVIASIEDLAWKQ